MPIQYKKNEAQSAHYKRLGLLFVPLRIAQNHSLGQQDVNFALSKGKNDLKSHDV